MDAGCYTALVTPFQANGGVDYDGLNRLIDFQITNGITGILAVGTTGESPTLSWDEHDKVVESVATATRGKCTCIAGAGSNNTAEALLAAKHAVASGADALLIVDPYYNGPSSIEIRREYVGPIARAVPDAEVIPYIIPGRTGAQMLPEDLALCHREFGNVRTVKEATGSIDNMRRTRECCGPDFAIFSGDDGMTYQMMTDPAVGAAGVISVSSNIAPKAVTEMVAWLNSGEMEKAEQRRAALQPLFDIVTVTTGETTPFGEVKCRARNPLALKALMNILGMPAGICRPPMGRMTRRGLDVVLAAARAVHLADPGILQPVADAFGVDIEERLETPAFREGLCYEEY